MSKKTKGNTVGSKDKYPCHLCGKVFGRNGLGGHMSRAHPGQSRSYKKKRQTAIKNLARLESLRRAQEKYRQEINPNATKKEMSRNLLKKYRKEIEESEEFRMEFGMEF